MQVFEQEILVKIAKMAFAIDNPVRKEQGACETEHEKADRKCLWCKKEFACDLAPGSPNYDLWKDFCTDDCAWQEHHSNMWMENL